MCVEVLGREDDDHINLQLISARVDASLKAIDVEATSDAIHI